MQIKMTSFKISILSALSLSINTFFLTTDAFADKNNKGNSSPRIIIFGDSTDQVDRGFTGQTINEKKIELYQYTDVQRALKQVSGVYVREEDGMGLRPNIGLRGTNPDRSKKIVLLEDDVLIGPAPYSAPAAYYTPNMNHVERLDVYKGFSAAHIGPNSVGGAINYVSSQINETNLRNYSQLTYGSFNSLNTKLGSSGPLSFGSYLIEGSFLGTDGFKKIDGGASTRVSKSEILGKVKWDISKGSQTQNLEFRVGLSFEDSNETYLGLSREDFNSNPYRRYSASALDNMSWNHQKYQVRHTLQISETGLIQSTAYRHNFNRTWNRVDRFRDNSAGRSLSNILNNPASEPIFYDILTGNLDSSAVGSNGELFLANNKREFYSQGIQSKYTDEFSLNLKSGMLKIEPEVFARVHQDQIFRDQTSNNYEMSGGELIAIGDPAQQTNLETQTTTAFTFSALSKLTYKSLILTPLLRLESVSYNFKNDITPASNSKSTNLAVIPGMSFFKRLTSDVSVGTSYNRAASLAGLSASGDEVKETADNYELLFKYLNQDIKLQADATAFYTDYQNITGTCTVSGGCTSGGNVAFNGGAANIYGLEAGMAKGFFLGAIYIPIGLNLTYLNATFASDFLSSSPEWGQGNVQKGDRLPYIPELQYTLTFGAEYKNFGSEFSYTSQTKVYDQSVQANRITIDDFSFLDLAGYYKVSEALKINYKISNIFDSEYAVAARPFGLRPGQPRAMQIGLKYLF
jgi:Fe(3+) dicitrate transport protein